MIGFRFFSPLETRLGRGLEHLSGQKKNLNNATRLQNSGLRSDYSPKVNKLFSRNSKHFYILNAFLNRRTNNNSVKTELLIMKKNIHYCNIFCIYKILDLEANWYAPSPNPRSASFITWVMKIRNWQII